MEISLLHIDGAANVDSTLWKWLQVRPQRESHQRFIIGYYVIIIFSTDGISTRGKGKDGQKTASGSKS